ncbi:hypothetical protein ILYODFUR_003484 [Ilyodon furcidens]|uniref:Uncharacterized protein n=1 Tax=Ilyodon furcidens TaxID=33524 RepID=A0ABV0UG21_9TELE
MFYGSPVQNATNKSFIEKCMKSICRQYAKIISKFFFEKLSRKFRMYFIILQMETIKYQGFNLPFIHPFSISTSSVQGYGGAGAYLQQSTGERRAPPWTGCQSIAGQHRDTQGKQPFTHPFIP